MKEQKESARRTLTNEHSKRHSRDQGAPMSSRRSVRSDHSDSSRRRRRPRGLSFTSILSNAVSDNSQHSDSSNALSRKTSHADDSDASNSNSSLGETDQDVWFPSQNNGDDINVDELDQLLHFSDDDSNGHHVIASGHRPTADHAEVSRPHFSEEEFDADNEEERDDATEPADAHPAANFRPQPINEGPSAFMPPPITKDSTPTNVSIAKAAGDCLSSGSSEEKDKFDESNTTSTELNKLHSKPADLNGPTGGPDGDVDQQSQRFSFYAPGLDGTIHAPDLASLVGTSESFSTLLDPANGTWFLDCFRPTDLEMKALSRAFGIHPLTTEDIQVKDAREKYEQFANYYLVVYHTFENDKDDPNYMESINFYILVFKEGVISFHFEPVSHCRNVRRRMRQLKDYVDFTPDWIAYALIDDITDSFAPEITEVEHEADFVEDAVYLEQTRSVAFHELLKRLGLARRHTMQLMRMLSGKADVVRGFAKRCAESSFLHNNEMRLYLGDIEDHIMTMYQNLSAYEKIFSRTHFNYMGLLQMQFVDSSNQMTKCLGYVSVLGSVLLPMNIVTSLWGMNVHVPGQDVENLRWFFSIMALIIFFVIILVGGGIFYLRYMAKKTVS